MTHRTSFFTRNIETILALLFTLFLALQYRGDRLWLAHAASAELVQGLYVLLLSAALLLEAGLLLRFWKRGRSYYLLTCIPVSVYLSGASAAMLLPQLTFGFFVLVGMMRFALFFRCRTAKNEEQKRKCSAMLFDLAAALCLMFGRFVTFSDLYSTL